MLLLLGVPKEVYISAVWFVVGAVLPDLDSPVSKPRRFMRLILLFVFLLVLLLLYPSILAVCVEVVGGCNQLPLIMVLLVFVAVGFVDMLIPGHRGFLHSLPAAALYGAGVCFLMWCFGMGVDSFWVGMWGLCGYASHLLVDFVGDAIPFK